nr:hypothetical protein TnSNPV_145 [Trichoplusia ni single nucleopolyhedrovirus]
MSLSIHDRLIMNRHDTNVTVLSIAIIDFNRKIVVMFQYNK